LKKLVFTGTAGRLGSYLRTPLAKICDELVTTDLADTTSNLQANERYVKADQQDLAAMTTLLDGADMVVHFGAIGDEAPFESLLGPKIIGIYTIWEAAYHNKVRRLVYASSIHAVGMCKKADFIRTDAPHRHDTFNGLAKWSSEDLASFYRDKRGVESVCMRILSCAQVTNPDCWTRPTLQRTGRRCHHQPFQPAVLCVRVWQHSPNSSPINTPQITFA
jgi:uronate dehydrogenase